MFWFKLVLCIAAGYALGNFSTGLWVGYHFGKTDIRKYGSGNPGTTNVLRTLGWIPSLLTLAGDALKGAAAAGIGYLLLGEMGARVGGLFSVIGRVWPVMYKFQGGKGIATSLGVVIVTDPLLLLALFILQIIVIAVTRYMSLASLISAVLYFIVICVSGKDALTIVCSAVLSGLLIYAHRSNIHRLIRGEENRLDFSKFKLKNTTKL